MKTLKRKGFHKWKTRIPAVQRERRTVAAAKAVQKTAQDAATRDVVIPAAAIMDAAIQDAAAQDAVAQAPNAAS